MADSETIVTQPESSSGWFLIFHICNLFYLQCLICFLIWIYRKAFLNVHLCVISNFNIGQRVIFLRYFVHRANLWFGGCIIHKNTVNVKRFVFLEHKYNW